MLFNSVHFLFFFPAVVIVYFIIPHRIRWGWLLFTSYYFYMSWNPKYALLIAISTIITYSSGILIERSNRRDDYRKGIREKQIWVALSFASNLSILILFKYFDFLIANINRILSIMNMTLIAPTFDVLLPVGISFYTFQALSYTMDVYRGEIRAEKNFGKYALFVSFFPQLVAGPIERSKNLLNQIHEEHKFDYMRVKNGLLLMLWGFMLKLLIADRVAILVNTVYNDYQSYIGAQLVVATVFFAIQIYCDFAGYSTIAIGAAQVMGFKLMDNFRQPYFAMSIQEFWHRWHISLSTWFRDYLYIPLGGNRCSLWRKRFNLMVTFLISGLWHGASWNYIVWGGVHGIYQVLGEILKPYRERLYKKLHIRTDIFSFKLGKMILTFILVNFAWIFFRAPSFRSSLEIIQRIFMEFNPHIFFDESLYTLGLTQNDFNISLVCICVLFVVDGVHYGMPEVSIRNVFAKQNLLFRWTIYFTAILMILIYGMYGMDYAQSQFIYFQF